MYSIRRSEERGRGNFGWLDSRHTFSFGSYYDEQHMGVSALRVINEDRVIPGAGFDTHGHRDMEIVSVVLEGEIAHKDSTGTVAGLRPGEVQLMSAGSGIRHSEFNPSATEGLHFLQIWIQPNVFGQTPGYQQQVFAQNEGMTLLASPDGAQQSMTIKQDATLWQLILPAAGSQSLALAAGRSGYLHLIEGQLSFADETLQPGDGLSVSAQKALTLQAGSGPVRALWFDLP